ncbi:hypothetical protein [Ornithinimicrobium kibberense]|uniref:hypothetical protein n=1 Tax=Ornithinimicrobium kibberense TaxID=282060 RepID=UPI00360E109F
MGFRRLRHHHRARPGLGVPAGRVGPRRAGLPQPGPVPGQPDRLSRRRSVVPTGQSRAGSTSSTQRSPSGRKPIRP